MDARAEPLLVHLVREQESRNQDNLFLDMTSLCAPGGAEVQPGEKRAGEPENSKPCIYSTKCVFYVFFQVFLMSELMTEQENFLSPLNIQTPPSSPLHPIVPREVSVLTI